MKPTPTEKTHRMQIHPDLYEMLIAQARKECRSPQTLLAMILEAGLNYRAAFGVEDSHLQRSERTNIVQFKRHA